jgi:hypothetical protein
MRRQLTLHSHCGGARLAQRLDRAAYRMNPYLMAIVVGLTILNITFLIGMSPPRPVGFDSFQLTATP